MAKSIQHNQISQSILRQGKSLGKCHSSPTKESNLLEKINCKIEKQAKRNLNEVDSFDNLLDTNNNFLVDLCFEQSVKNISQNNDITGWHDIQTSKRSITQERTSRIEKTSFNFNTVHPNNNSQRAVSANISVIQTPLISRRKTFKYNDNSGNISQQNQNINDLDIETLAFTSQQSEKKNNSLNSPQVLLSNIIGQNYRFSSSPKNISTYPVVSSFDINIIGGKQKDNTSEIKQRQFYQKRKDDENFKYSLNEWKNYLNRYDSSSDLYDVNLNKKHRNALQTFTTQYDEENFCGIDIDSEQASSNNFQQQNYVKENFESKIKNKNLSIDISHIDEKKQCQNSPQNQVQQQNQDISMNQTQYDKMNLSQRYSYRSTKSSQASRLFGRKKKIMRNTSENQNTNNIKQSQQQINKEGQTGVYEIRQRAMSYNLPNNNENVKSSSSLSNKQSNINIQNNNNGNSQLFNENNNYKQISSKQFSQKELKLNQLVAANQTFSNELFSTVNQQIESSYYPQELLSQKNTQVKFVFSRQNTSPSNPSLENQDIYKKLMIKSNLEKDKVNRNQSLVLKSTTSAYHPKRSQNYNSGNAFQQISKEKIKQVIQQKNNYNVFRLVNNNGNSIGLQNINQTMNQGQNGIIQNLTQNNSINNVLCDAGNFKFIRNKDTNKDNYIIKNIETNERLNINIPLGNQNQQKFDETSLLAIKRTRINSITNIQEYPTQKDVTPFNIKKIINLTDSKQQLRPSIKNIFPDENNIMNSKRINTHLKNSNSIQISEKLTPINAEHIIKQDKKMSCKNNVNNDRYFPKLLTSKN